MEEDSCIVEKGPLVLAFNTLRRSNKGIKEYVETNSSLKQFKHIATSESYKTSILQGPTNEILCSCESTSCGKDLWLKIKLLIKEQSLTKYETCGDYKLLMLLGTTRKYTPGASVKQTRGKQSTCYLFTHCKVGSYCHQCTKTPIGKEMKHGLPDIQTSQTVIHPTCCLSRRDLVLYSVVDDSTQPRFALMAKSLMNGSDALTEVHNHDNLNYDLFNQSEQIMTSSEQSNDVSQTETDITSDSNIIPYSQYLSETQQETVQNSNSSAQQDVLIMSCLTN
ncbi:hypothetical protein Tco_0313803 [Tanacetum coccineum]